MNNIQTMLKSAQSSNPVSFNKAFNSEIKDRIGTAFAERRAEIVSSMFSTGS